MMSGVIERAFGAFVFVTAALCAGVAWPAMAAAPGDAGEPGWGVTQLMRRLAQVKSAQARFVEEKYLQILTQPIETSGALAWQAPDRLEKRTLKPHAETMLLEHDRLSIEVPGKATQSFGVQDNPVLWGFIESIRATLAGDLGALEKFYTVRLEGSAARWTLVLAPRETRMRSFITEIRIGGAQRVTRVEVWEHNGDHSVMTITEGGA